MPSSSTSCRPQRTKETDNAGRFPEYCFFCKKTELRIRQGGKNKYEYPTKFEYPDATKVTLLASAKLRNDVPLIRSIEHVHLGEKDFRKHNTCYQKYVKPKTIEQRQSSSEEDETYKKAKSIISLKIIENGGCMPIDRLVEVCGFQET